MKTLLRSTIVFAVCAAGLAVAGQLATERLVQYDRASVRIESGCSGTLVGPRQVLTAGHCYETGQRVVVILHDGRRFAGRVVCARDDEIDAALICLDTKAVLPFVPLAEQPPPVGAEVLVYGVPSAAGVDRILRYRARVKSRDGRWLELTGRTAPIAGESGGGVFYDGKLVGVIARTQNRVALYTGQGNWGAATKTSGLLSLLARRRRGDCGCDGGGGQHQQQQLSPIPEREPLVPKEVAEDLKRLQTEIETLQNQIQKLKQIAAVPGPRGERGPPGPPGPPGKDGKDFDPATLQQALASVEQRLMSELKRRTDPGELSKQIAPRLAPIRFRLYGPNGQLLQESQVRLGETQNFYLIPRSQWPPERAREPTANGRRPASISRSQRR